MTAGAQPTAAGTKAQLREVVRMLEPQFPAERRYLSVESMAIIDQH